MSAFTESTVENAALAWLEMIGRQVAHLPAPQSNAAQQARTHTDRHARG